MQVSGAKRQFDELKSEFISKIRHELRLETGSLVPMIQAVCDSMEAWARMKAKGDRAIRPVSLMPLETYMGVWSIPKEQMYAFHALPIGAIGTPMPFGNQWCVYRLLEKRVANLEEFSSKQDEYYKQLTLKKQYEALKAWIEDLKRSAHLKVLPSAAARDHTRVHAIVG